MESIPGLSLSSGPAISDAQSGGGNVGTGDFNFKPKTSLIERLAPWVAVAVILWINAKK